MALEDEIKRAEEEEMQSQEMYGMMAIDAERMGQHDMARMMREVAGDEGRHAMMMRSMISGGGITGVSYYWEVSNMVTGKWMEYYKEYPTQDQALQAAKDIYADTYPDAVNQHLVIKIFSKSPEARAGLTYEPEITKSYWISGEKTYQQIAEEQHYGMPQGYMPEGHRPFPQTYGDWVSLGENIKTKAGIDDFKTTAEVNEHLYHIYKEEQDPATAQVAKRWLAGKAAELGVS